MSFGGRDGIWAVERCGKSEAEVWRTSLLLDMGNNGNRGRNLAGDFGNGDRGKLMLHEEMMWLLFPCLM